MGIGLCLMRHWPIRQNGFYSFKRQWLELNQQQIIHFKLFRTMQSLSFLQIDFSNLRFIHSRFFGFANTMMQFTYKPSNFIFLLYLAPFQYHEKIVFSAILLAPISMHIGAISESNHP